MEKNIESHLIEKRVFKPSREIAKNARIKSLAQYRKMYRESIRSPDRFWAREAKELIWHKSWKKVLDLESTLREMVCRRSTQSLGKLPGSSSCRSTTKQSGYYLGR